MTTDFKETSRFYFGRGEDAERRAHEALTAHEAVLTPGTPVRVYRGSQLGLTGIVADGDAGARRVYVVEDGGSLRWTFETRNLEVMSTVRIAVDYENNAEEWWDAAQKLDERVQPLYRVVQDLLAHAEATATQGELEWVRKQAADLPGWTSGMPHAPHPFTWCDAEVAS